MDSLTIEARRELTDLRKQQVENDIFDNLIVLFGTVELCSKVGDGLIYAAV